MKSSYKRKPFNALTLVELLVVIAVICILAALLFPGISGSKENAKRTLCMNDLRQLGTGIHMYLDDQYNGSPGSSNATHSPFLAWTDYRDLIKNYVGVKGAASAQDRVFACPSDTFFYDMRKNGQGYVPHPMHEQADHAFTSYAYNAGMFSTPPTTNSPGTTNYYGIAGRRLETVRNPARTVLIAEVPAFSPYSWHQPKRPLIKDNATFNDARNMVCFIDGHSSYLKIYFNGKKIAWDYDPPAGYDYQWGGD
jgi:prepilin-type N-terminal cleavage/methylation domain-containing protein